MAISVIIMQSHYVFTVMTPGVGCRITITSEYPAIIITESEIQQHLILHTGNAISTKIPSTRMQKIRDFKP